MGKKKKEFNMFSYLKKYKFLVIFGPLCKGIEASTEVVVPLLMSLIIDVGIVNNDRQYIIGLSVAILALNIFAMLFAVLGQKAAAITSESMGRDIRNDMYSHINSFSHAELDKYSTTSLLNRTVHDVQQLQEGTASFLRTAMRIPFLLIGSLVMAIIIDLKLSIVFAIVTPLLILTVFFIIKKIDPLLKSGKIKLDKTSDITRENLNGIRVVRAFNKQDYEISKFEKANYELVSVELKEGFWSALLQPLIVFLIDFSIIALIYFGGIQINIGQLSQGNLIAFINYFGQIAMSLIMAARLVTIFTRMNTASTRINDVFETKNSIVSPIKPVKIDYSNPNLGNIKFNHVSFSYNNLKNAINDLDIEIKAGETIGIIGGTGSGKSSVINLIPRFYDATKGSVFVGDVNVKHYDLRELRSLISIVPQNPILFEGTIKSNMLWRNNNATNEEIIKALKIAQSYDFVKEYPDFIDHKVNRGGTNFSGGQRQRLTIARAIINKPHILILDDSTSALDFATDAKLRKAIKNNLSDTTLIIVTQRTNSIKDADKIIVMDYGNIVGIGTHEELLNNCEIYKEIHYSQNTKEGK